MAVAYLHIVKAEYDYEAAGADEMTVKEDEILFVLESDDPSWWKVRAKVSPSSGTTPSQAPSGLVPASYVSPLTPVKTVKALYAYDAQADAEEEISIAEDELLDYYEDDGDWALVGKQGAPGVGYAPAAYVEDHDANAPVAAIQHADDPEEVEDDEDEYVDAHEDTHELSRSISGNPKDVQTWPALEVDKKKKKKKGTLGVGSGNIFFASESDKAPVQQYQLDQISEVNTDKPKHIVLTFPDTKLHFILGTKDQFEQVIRKIDAGRGDVQPAPATTSAPTPAFIPPPPPPPPAAAQAPAFIPPPPPPPPPVSAPPVATPPVRIATNGQPSGKRAVVQYDFEAQADDELNVAEGDIVYIVDEAEGDWCKVRSQSGQEGVVPTTYLEIDDDTSNQSGIVGVMDPDDNAEDDEVVAQRLRDQQAAERREERARAKERELMRQAQGMSISVPPSLPKRDSAKSRQSPASVTPSPTVRTQPDIPRIPSPPPAKSRPTAAEPVQRSKPSPAKTRTWKDRTGAFKVDAEFVGISNGKIRLHKTNGVVIEVPIEKMSHDDLHFLEKSTGKKFIKDDQRDARRRSESEQSSSRDKEREREKERERQKAQALKSRHNDIDWFEFFLNAGCDMDDCTRYANNFQKDRIDESILPDMEASTFRSLGLREGDIIRVQKFIKQKYADNGPKVPAKSESARQAQIAKDEELARKLQEEEGGSPVSPTGGKTSIFGTPGGGIKNTRRGRPTPSRNGTSQVSFDSITTSMAAANERVASPVERIASPTKEPTKRSSSTIPMASGFDDDAWTVKPASKPPTPSPAVAISTPTPTPPPRAPTPPSQPIPSITENRPSSAAASTSTGQQLTDSYLASLGLNQPRPTSTPNAMQSQQTGYAPSPSFSPQPTGMQSQPTGMMYNGPRGPLAPVAQNQHLLNPLIPTNTGMNSFIPTRSTASPMLSQPTGYMQPQQSYSPQPSFVSPQQTGFMNSQPTGMMPQPAGMMSQPTGMMSQSTGMMSQPTGMMPQATGMNSMGYGRNNPLPMNQIQMQPTGFMGQPQQMAPAVPQIPQQYQQQQAQQSSNNSQFQPSNVFASMKAGAMAKAQDGNLSGPQSEQKYDALRPQPTGFQGGFQQQQPAPLQAQMTGFAPGGMLYQPPQQTGYGFGQQPYRQY